MYMAVMKTWEDLENLDGGKIISKNLLSQVLIKFEVLLFAFILLKVRFSETELYFI